MSNTPIFDKLAAEFLSEKHIHVNALLKGTDSTFNRARRYWIDNLPSAQPNVLKKPLEALEETAEFDVMPLFDKRVLLHQE